MEEKIKMVLEKIEKDYLEFKTDVLTLPSDKLYDCAYKIHSVEEFYQILSEYNFTEETLNCILKFPYKFLLHIYSEWLKVDMEPPNTKRCTVCNQLYIPKSNRAKYCEKCRKSVWNRQKADYIRKRRYNSRKLKR